MIVFETPPPKKRARNGKTEALASWAQQARGELARRPGEWARIRDFKSPTRAWPAINTILDRRLMPGCELTARKTDTGSAIWGRFIPRRTGRDFAD